MIKVHLDGVETSDGIYNILQIHLLDDGHNPKARISLENDGAILCSEDVK